MFFRSPKARFTDVSLPIVSMFVSQYIEAMKHAKTRRDHRFKEYLFDAITLLGIPRSIDQGTVVEVENDTEVYEEIIDESVPKIVRKIS